MNAIIETLLGVDTLTDQVIATDLLISAKNGVRNYAVALTETATPEARTILRKQFEEAINMHENVMKYMVNRGWYHPYNALEQIQMDMRTSQTALNVADRKPTEEGR